MSRRRAAVVLVLTLAVAGAGCTGGGGAPSPSHAPDPGNVTDAATVLAKALAAKDLRSVPLAGATPDQATAALKTTLGPLAGLTPAVAAATPSVDGERASSELSWTWTFPGVTTRWTYRSVADFTRSGGRWLAAWRPSLVEPDLFPGQRLTVTRTPATRGDVLDGGGHAIVRRRAVDTVGLDKADVPVAAQPASATALARLVGVDSAAFQRTVTSAGPKQFVAAVTYRATAADRPTDRAVHAIRGGRVVPGFALLAPTRQFARSVLGTVGDATLEIVDASKGTVVASDTVGLSGLQRRYDPQLRGQPGVTVGILDAPASPSTGAPSSGQSSDQSTDRPSDQPSDQAPDQPSSSATPTRTVFNTKPVAGAALRLTLQTGLQQSAEQILAGVQPASALVAIRPSTGAVLAAATGPGADEQAIATTGQYAPGSTFKVVTSLALLRAGLTPSSVVSCPARLVVDGKPFKNYNDYPASALGSITLRTAVAQSCNTAMIGQRDRVSPAALAAAAASLGLGRDYDVGFSSYFGSIPADATPTGHAAAMIGQGKVLASPLAMAAVAASVAKGATVVPQLVGGHAATPVAAPLTAAEAASLRSLMESVVADGSGRVLQGVGSARIGAKTGTAEYGTDVPPRTHAWMIAFQGDLAVAVFVADGSSGSGTAGPLLKKFLQAAAG